MHTNAIFTTLQHCANKKNNSKNVNTNTQMSHVYINILLQQVTSNINT